MSGHEHDHAHPHDHGHEHDGDHRTSTVTGGSGLGSGMRSGRTPTITTARSTRCSNPRPKGLRALWISLAALAATALAQAVVVALSGSVALLGDALHNSADALTAVPLGFAFLLSRRRPTRRYTYGYGRAEDLAGIVIVAVIVLSSAAAAYAADRPAAAPAPGHPPARGRDRGRARLRRQRAGRPLPDQDRPPDRLGRAGRRRPARPHRRVHLAGRAGRGGRGGDRLALGRPGGGAADHGGHPRGGLAGGPRGRPAADGQRGPGADRDRRRPPCAPPRACWPSAGSGCAGSAATIRAECEISVDPACSVVQAHDIAVGAEHALIHAIPRLAAASVHADPLDGTDHHAVLLTTRPASATRHCTSSGAQLHDHAGGPRRGAGSRPAGSPSGWPRPGPPRPPRRG